MKITLIGVILYLLVGNCFGGGFGSSKSPNVRSAPQSNLHQRVETLEFKQRQNKAGIDQNRSNIEAQAEESIQISGSSENNFKNVYAGGNLIGVTDWDSFLEDGYYMTMEFNPEFDPIQVNGYGKKRRSNIASVITFALPDCQGEAFILIEENPLSLQQREKGSIFSCESVNCLFNLYYIAHQTSNVYRKTNESSLGMVEGAKCQNRPSYNPSTYNIYYKLIPNDPAITGINQYPFPLPITIEGLQKLNIVED